MITRQTRLLRYLDEIRLWHLLLAAALITFVFACAYFRLEGHPNNIDGLMCGKNPCQQSFYTDLYFSVVTEATLGYGDVAPLGFARGVACLQVAVGLLFAGIVITKIASLERGQHNRIAHQLRGDWIEYIELADRQMISFSIFSRVGDRIAYEGENFDEKGEPIGYFSGSLMSGDKDSYRFRYSNRETDDKASLTEGYCQIDFFRSGKKWISFKGVIRDFVDKANYRQTGWPASQEECKIINSMDDEARRNLVVKLFADQTTKSESSSTKTAAPK